ncbi:MAG: hypothetical protein ISS49_13125 [Anaerolineae bacterium]|nr:hypothetical protein [Anaerolineae bacterium]
MSVRMLELTPPLFTALRSIKGENLRQKLARLLASQLRRNLEACEREALDLEIKYGLEYKEFQARLGAGELGDEFAYELERDAMRWSDLRVEKRHWLGLLRPVKKLI